MGFKEKRDWEREHTKQNGKNMQYNNVGFIQYQLISWHKLGENF